MRDFLQRLPKAELHLHIEGSLEPELMFTLAERNGVTLPYDSVEAVKAAYEFDDLQGFLDLYYQGMSVLRSAEDFHDLAMDYFRRAHADGVVHVEMHFDPQAHLARGVELETVMEGLGLACREVERELGMSTAMIMAFLRDRPAEAAMAVLERAAPTGSCSMPWVWTAPNRVTRRRNSPKCSGARRCWAFPGWPMPGRRGRRNISAKRSICSRCVASTMGYAVWRIRHW